jgi:hypothetical protein
MRRRIRLLLVGRFLSGDTRRWLLYFTVSAVWKRLRKLRAGEPEMVYRTVMGPGHRLEVRTDRPLPAKLRSRRLRKELEAAYRAELGE